LPDRATGRMSLSSISTNDLYLAVFEYDGVDRAKARRHFSFAFAKELDILVPIAILSQYYLTASHFCSKNDFGDNDMKWMHNRTVLSNFHLESKSGPISIRARRPVENKQNGENIYKFLAGELLKTAA
jgi:hypothetical protein